MLHKFAKFLSARHVWITSRQVCDSRYVWFFPLVLLSKIPLRYQYRSHYDSKSWLGFKEQEFGNERLTVFEFILIVPLSVIRATGENCSRNLRRTLMLNSCTLIIFSLHRFIVLACSFRSWLNSVKCDRKWLFCCFSRLYKKTSYWS